MLSYHHLTSLAAVQVVSLKSLLRRLAVRVRVVPKLHRVISILEVLRLILICRSLINPAAAVAQVNLKSQRLLRNPQVRALPKLQRALNIPEVLR